MISAPCGNLIERDGGSCILDDREFPTDCANCAAYVCGLNEQERDRFRAWTKAMAAWLSGCKSCSFVSKLKEIANEVVDNELHYCPSCGYYCTCGNKEQPL